MIELKGRTRTAVVEPEIGATLLKHALKAKVDWSSNCTRGTCARCRCLIEEGAAALEGITDAEWDRMEPEEFEDGYRLACQAVVKSADILVKAVNKPYF
ncbi:MULTISPECIES: 2Fe-2S iron-sulfur cluster-binding protein [unclassified Paenibacillus]|uniref:2Fe-2S iron-sulfur cluster-binding protein n=1 Tax=unclassified Paenibacillus TaxID=185978 RepID=UPI00104AEDC2|nr:MULTISPECIES: 2Fe-2S iron-sulfur cluster-binding protein [unclassified Paenibacillus]NIK67701.1 2Fe-2S ferredoxin [Paenibacillus sp. BK720]TCN01742.1 2Fe-2S ferredoxin [Paenibacillus sp. BK033]